MNFSTIWPAGGPPPGPRADAIRPTAESPRGTFLGLVQDNRRICTDHFRLVLRVAGFPASCPGQFVQLDCRDSHADEVSETNRNGESGPQEFDWPPAGSARPVPVDPDFLAPLAYLRRPFSIADHRSAPDGASEIDIIHRVVGRGTQLLASLEPGRQVRLIGPLGRGFPIPADLQMACLVGGGVGIPPMLYLAKALRQRGGVDGAAFLGALRHDLLPVTHLAPPPAGTGEPASSQGDPVHNVAEFSEWGFRTAITTDDGSLGMKGLVTTALRRFLERRRGELSGLAGTVVYCCGPTPMMKATARVAAELNIACLASLEQPMACGMGTCQSCIIKYRPHTAPPGTDWTYKLTCTDGPVFDTRDLLW